MAYQEPVRTACDISGNAEQHKLREDNTTAWLAALVKAWAVWDLYA
jgi:hypothetical protein